MTEKFDNKFHQRYVGGQGEVAVDERPTAETNIKVMPTTLEDVLAEYRKYVRDPKAELPEEILSTLVSIQRTENDRK